MKHRSVAEIMAVLAVFWVILMFMASGCAETEPIRTEDEESLVEFEVMARHGSLRVVRVEDRLCVIVYVTRGVDVECWKEDTL